MKRLKNLILIGLTGLMCLLITASSLAVYEVGDTVTDFTLMDAYGNPVSLSDYEGMVTLLAFWSPT
ncbi:redoxin domain-containing protein [bacterium]|nr:redoxin domain-containing protein [candidate division CSSED10-310 bacterium]